MLNVPALQLCSDFDVDELHLTCLMVHRSPAASVQCLSEGGYAFLGPISAQVTGLDGIVCPRLIRFSATTLQS